MAQRKLLIADGNEDFLQALRQALKEHYQVRCCINGPDTLRWLQQDPPDLLILEPLLPELDGLMLLRMAAQKNIRVPIFLISRGLNDYMLAQTAEFRIVYALRKPCPIQAAVFHIASIFQYLDQRSSPAAREAIAKTLIDEMQIRSSYRGYGYMIPAIRLLAQDPGQSITKELYPAVAKIFGIKHTDVERCIRNAIEQTWPRRNRAVWDRYFPDFPERPSNAVFLLALAEELSRRLE